MFISNHKYEILSDIGFVDFKGIKTTINNILEVEFTDKTILNCSPGHILIDKNGNEIEAQFLINGIEIQSEYGNKTVCSITNLDLREELYDLVDVDTHLYYTNGILSHNCDCDFTTSGHTIVDADDLKYYYENHVTDPIEKRGMAGLYWVWDYVDYSKSYVVSADVARGDGADDSAFGVFEVESNVQVAEWIGKAGTTEYGKMLVAVATEWNNALLVIENSNIGWATVQTVIDCQYTNLYYSYKVTPYIDPAIHLSKMWDLANKEDMTPGHSTNTATRPSMITKLENYTKEKTFIYKSARLHSQLQTFKWINGKAKADSGYKDDAVLYTAIYLFVRDTALKLRQMGLDLTRKSVQKSFRPISKPTTSFRNPYEMKYGSKKISFGWLVK